MTTPMLASLIILILLALICYWLGYEAGIGDARDIRKRAHAQIRELNRQKSDLSQWIRSHWPTEYAAYNHGVEEGYQQGINHAADLIDEEEDQ